MLYAVNTRTKEHRLWSASFTPSQYAHEWAVVNADADGWIPWPGCDECPLPDGSVVDIRYRYPGGKEIQRVWPAEDNNWLEVVAYRPILDTKHEAPLKDKPWWSVYQPEPPEWDGEGLPPDGTKCECKRYPAGVEWVECKVVGHDLEDGFYLVVARVGSEYLGLPMAFLRPLRTDEEKAVEEMQEHVGGHVKRDSILKALYRAGYRKEK